VPARPKASWTPARFAVMANPEAVPYCERTSKDHPRRGRWGVTSTRAEVDRVVNPSVGQHQLDVQLGQLSRKPVPEWLAGR
jgi:hypothetical protein